jgi:hypothetical protein
MRKHLVFAIGLATPLFADYLIQRLITLVSLSPF